MKTIKNFFIELWNTIRNIFVPETLILSNSTEVTPPKPISPYIFIGLLISAIYFIQVTGFDIVTIIRRIEQIVPILGRVFNPDLSYAESVVDPIFDTIQMSFLGTLLGVAFAMPVAFFASANINNNRLLVGITKIILVFFRTYPIIVYAMILVLLFGYGTFAGTIAITIFTFSIVTKMLYEHIETIDLGAFEAMQATGSSLLKSFITAILPEILPAYYSIALYSFEINIRHAAVLGYVNAGGVGMVMNDRMSLNEWEKLGTILLALFIVVFVIETLSKQIRKRLV